MLSEKVGDVLENVFSAICGVIITFIPLGVFLVLKWMLEPVGFWQNLTFFLIAGSVFGAIQITSLALFILFLIKLFKGEL